MFLHPPQAVRLRLVLAAAGLCAATAAYVTSGLRRRRSGARGPWSRLAAAGAYSVVALFLCGELWFASADRSHSVNYTLAGKLWLERHYRYNSYGHRGPEPNGELLAGRRRIVVVGDSFAAGHGVLERERFSDVLAARTPPDHVVVNIAVSGADARALYQGLCSFPWPPHVLVLSYFGNDIFEAAEERGHSPPPIVPYDDLPAPAASLVRRSYFLDHLYWSRPRGELRSWWSFFGRVWSDPETVALHERDLSAFVDYARTRGIPLIVVLFPFLHDPQGSAAYVPRVHAFFTGRGIPVLDVARLIEDLPLSERIASINDVHPSPRVHLRVAEALARELPALIAAEPR